MNVLGDLCIIGYLRTAQAGLVYFHLFSVILCFGISVKDAEKWEKSKSEGKETVIYSERERERCALACVR